MDWSQKSLVTSSQIYLVSEVSRLVLGPTQPHIHWTIGALYPRVQWQRGVTHLNLVQKLRMSGAMPPCPHVPSWWIHKQLYFTRPCMNSPIIVFTPVNITGHSEKVSVPLVMNRCIRIPTVPSAEVLRDWTAYVVPTLLIWIGSEHGIEITVSVWKGCEKMALSPHHA
jgi:hypothetical protein